jgi:hypothetical protein
LAHGPAHSGFKVKTFGVGGSVGLGVDSFEAVRGATVGSSPTATMHPAAVASKASPSAARAAVEKLPDLRFMSDLQQ